MGLHFKPDLSSVPGVVWWGGLVLNNEPHPRPQESLRAACHWGGGRIAPQRGVRRGRQPLRGSGASSPLLGSCGLSFPICRMGVVAVS